MGFFKKIKAKIEHKQQPEPAPETKDQSSAPSKASSSRDEDVPKKEEPPLTLQERLWNTAYDGLKADQPDTVETYETLLSGELHKDGDKSDDSVAEKNEIGSSRETRRQQMVQLVNVGLARTQKEAKIKGGIDEASNAVFAVKGVMDKAVTASPEAAVAWVGVCFALEVSSLTVLLLLQLLTRCRSCRTRLRRRALIAVGLHMLFLEWTGTGIWLVSFWRRTKAKMHWMGLEGSWKSTSSNYTRSSCYFR